MSRLIAIGDIHGCLDQLDYILDKLNLTKGDAVVFLGDYIDRGPNSSGVIDRLIELKNDTEGPTCFFLRGNHEDMFLQGALGGDDAMLNGWLSNGGGAMLDSYEDRKIPVHHVDFLSGTDLFIETDNYIFVHAGFDPDETITHQTVNYNWYKDTMLWGRDHLYKNARTLPWEKFVVHGHSVQRKGPKKTKKYICIDTGSFVRNRKNERDRLQYYLTSVILPDDPKKGTFEYVTSEDMV
jgi:serine/threonine protein phosphatase 1